MSSPPSYDELQASLSAARDQTKYRLYFAALLASAARIPLGEFIVVGGSAIEIYTVGEYTSGDIDIVSTHGERVRGALQSWKFKGEGRGWWSEELSIYVDLVSWPYTGSMERTTLMTTPYGVVRLAAIEDLLVKRLSSTKHWKQAGDLEHAKMLAFQFFDRIDWEYVERFAREHAVGELAGQLRAAVLKAREKQ